MFFLLYDLLLLLGGIAMVAIGIASYPVQPGQPAPQGHYGQPQGQPGYPTA